MPKASVNEDYFLAAREDQIWPAWQVFPVKPVAVPRAVSSLRTAISGLVSFCRTARIILLRFSLETLSTLGR